MCLCSRCIEKAGGVPYQPCPPCFPVLDVDTMKITVKVTDTHGGVHVYHATGIDDAVASIDHMRGDYADCIRNLLESGVPGEGGGFPLVNGAYAEVHIDEIGPHGGL